MPFSVRAALEQFSLAHPSGAGQLTISIAAPAAHAPDGGVPVLYVVDGDLLFGMAAEIARAVTSVTDFPAHYVVGIGYDAAYADVLKLRTADLAPPIAAAALESLGGLGVAIGGAEGGGADAFLAFLTDRLRPEIAARYPQTADGPQILFGHSLGGLFAAYALLTRPGSFATFLANSPSLWWDGFAILGHLPAFADKLAEIEHQPRVLVGVGGKEQDLPSKVPVGMDMALADVQALVTISRMVDSVPEFTAALRDAGLTDVAHFIYDGEDHGSVVPAAMMRGLCFAVPNPE